MSPTQENIYIKTEQEIRLTVEYNYESWESVINLDDYRCYGCENNQDLEFFLTKFVKNDKVSFTFNDTHLQIYFTIDLGFKKITKVIILPKVRTLTDVEKLKYQLTEKECENKCLKDQLEIFPKQMVICNSIITRDMTDCIPVIPKIPPGITYKKYYDFINNCLQKNIEILPLLIKVGYGIDWDDLSSNPNAVHILEKNLDKVDWDCLSGNPNAIHILEKNIDKVDWDCLSGNPNAVHILEKNIDKVDWGDLSWNPNAVHILEKNIDKVDWEMLSRNPNAVHILEKNIDKVNWKWLSRNPNAVHILEKNIDKVDWDELSMNPNAVHILEKNIDKVDWEWLSGNPDIVHIAEKNLDKVDWKRLSGNPNAVHILEKNIDKVNWDWLSRNPNAVHILEKNIDKVDWEWLSGNPNAIHILEKNLDKVDWDCLSDNPNFIQSYFYSTSNKLSVLDKISQISNLLSSLRTYFYVSQIAEMQKNLKLKDSKIEEMKNKLVNLVTDCNNKIVDIEREHYRQLHSLPAYSHFR